MDRHGPACPTRQGGTTFPAPTAPRRRREGFRDLYAGFHQVGAAVFGLSTQSSAYQRELAERLALPFEIVSDEQFALQRALALPTFATGGVTYLKRLTLAIRDGRIERVYYPIASPAAHRARGVRLARHDRPLGSAQGGRARARQRTDLAGYASGPSRR